MATGSSCPSRTTPTTARAGSSCCAGRARAATTSSGLAGERPTRPAGRGGVPPLGSGGLVGCHDDRHPVGHQHLGVLVDLAAHDRGAVQRQLWAAVAVASPPSRMGVDAGSPSATADRSPATALSALATQPPQRASRPGLGRLRRRRPHHSRPCAPPADLTRRSAHCRPSHVVGETWPGTTAGVGYAAMSTSTVGATAAGV